MNVRDLHLEELLSRVTAYLERVAVAAPTEARRVAWDAVMANVRDPGDVFAVLWTIGVSVARMVMSDEQRAEGASAGLVFVEVDGDVTRVTEPEDTPAMAVLVGRFLTACINGDVATGHALFVSITNPGDADEFLKALRRLSGQVLQAAFLDTVIEIDEPT